MSPSDLLRAAQVRAASTYFLRLRPLVVLLGVVAQGVVLARAGVPLAQRQLLALVLGAALVAFTLESLVLTRRQVSERWLVVSLAATMAHLTLASSLTGGLGSPLPVLLLAPLAVALAALGRRAVPLAILFGLALLALALTPALGPALPASVAPSVHAIALVLAAALVTLGVVGLGEAHARVSGALDAMRQGAIEESAARAREAEALGARVAHELKNPLAAISALVTLTARRAEAPKDQERLAVVREELARMEQTIDDYLTLARPLADVSLAPVPLAALIAEVHAVLEARAELAGVRVEPRVAPGLVVTADARRLREALVNLAINAIESLANGGGGVLSIEAARGPAGSVEIAVVDDGPGMPPEIRDRAGEAFLTRREGGTGLGLRVARSVARMHGGDLVLEHPARGLRAVLRLPEGR